MTIVSSLDLATARQAIADWLAGRVDADDSVTLDEVVVPSSGYSGDQVLCTATWAKDGALVSRGLVFRLEPSPKYQLFPDTNLFGQFAVLQSLNQVPGAPTPEALWFEGDPRILGERFYVMERVPGSVADKGAEWVQRLSDTDHRTMWWRGLTAMAAVHSVDVSSLSLRAFGSSWVAERLLDEQLDYNLVYYQQVVGEGSYPATEAAFDWLRTNKPPAAVPTIQWGDARLGNTMFDDDGSCTALIDWEQAQVGFAEADLAWWLFVEGRESPFHGDTPRLDRRVPPTDEALGKYAELIRRPLTDMRYWHIFALARIAPIMLKLDALASEFGQGYPGGNYAEPILAELLGL